MKRLLTLLTIIGCLSFSLSAQRRLVLIEEFTNVGCGPCASWSPVLDSAIYYRLGDCIAIKYHSNYPDRTDPFYLYQQEAHQQKVDFYHVTGVPTTFVDGVEILDRSFAYMNAAIDYQMSQPASYTLNVEKQLEGNHLTVQTRLTPLSDVENPSLRLFVAAIEEHIVSPTPYPNGETELNYTMRRMLTPATGHVPGETLSAGTVYDWQGEWDVDAINDMQQLGVVAFLQDVETHQVLATAYSGPVAEKENQLTLLSVSDTPDLICKPEYYGQVILRNDGANRLTSATLNVKVNGALEQYPWTGSLDYLERDTMTFSGFTNFKLASVGRNQVEVWFSDVNATAATSGKRFLQFDNSVQATYGVRLKIYTDKKPEETTWELRNSAGTIVRQGGPYHEARKFFTEDFDLRSDDCYQLLLLDSGGDGIKGAAGNGYYQLFQLDADGKQTRLAQGDYEGASHIVNFNLTLTPAPDRQRLVLFEEFTNTSCDPCADFSPSLDKTIYDRMGDMVAITYHWNFPSARDPFYLTNPDDVMARAGFYGISGVPALFVDGQHVGAWGYESYLDAYVDGASQVEPLVELSTQAAISRSADDAQLQLHVSMLPLASMNGRDLRLFAAVVEERIDWEEPAANGERSWNYVMRRLLPGSDGQPLGDGMMQVTPYQYEFAWTPQNFYDANELGIVTFVQDIATKEVLGTTYTPRPTGSTSAAKILQVSNMPDRICSPAFTSDLTVRNTGRDPLTSATINVRINGALQSTPWSGRMDYLDIDTLHVPLFDSFPLSEGVPNEVEIWLSELNGGAEESVHKTFSMANAHKAQHAVRLTLMTDNAPEETTWKVYNSLGDVVCEGGPYTEKRKKHVTDLPLTTDDCYLLEFCDAGGNGITGENGRGYYMLHEVNADGQTRLLVQADYTGATHQVYFSLQHAQQLGIEPATAEQGATPQRYDLQGRRVSPHHRGIYIENAKKKINP